jgi:predicted  nucleic acid-binding Zn-ribbon protein
VRVVDSLRQLQDIDQRSDAARATITQLRAQLGDRAAIERREAELSQQRQGLHALESRQRDLELQAETRRGKIQADEAKLYSGRVTSPKELSSLSDEVAQDRRQLGAVEDDLLNLFEELDEARSRVQELEAALARESQEWTTAQAAAQARVSATETSLSSLEQQRGALVKTIPTAVQTTYQTLRRQKGGLAVAPVLQRTCQACRVGLTPAQEQRARIGTDLVLCNSCARAGRSHIAVESLRSDGRRQPIPRVHPDLPAYATAPRPVSNSSEDPSERGGEFTCPEIPN